MAASELPDDLKQIKAIIDEYREYIYAAIEGESRKSPFPSFAKLQSVENSEWVEENYERFLRDTQNESVVEESYLSEMGYITALAYTKDGSCVVAGHSTGLVQVRNGTTGKVLSTLRHIQFPPRPVYAVLCSRTEEGVCYAACTDGVVYRLQIEFHSEPDLECLQIEFFGATGVNANTIPFITSRSAALSFGLASDGNKMVVGYADSSVKIYDMETQESTIAVPCGPRFFYYSRDFFQRSVGSEYSAMALAQVLSIYKMLKQRLKFLPKNLQRMHTGQVCALQCHPDRPTVFASGAWDDTLRIWDMRCDIGCMMTFEAVNITGNSLDLNRDLCIAGSWQPVEALTAWDLTARKQLCVVNAQNRRRDVDGEYLYACKFWRSSQYNRKGKYAIVGGSGLGALEIINLHNRYIACSFPAAGSILAVDSFGDKIAYGGTEPVFGVVSFHDPKHETEEYTDQVDVMQWAEESAIECEKNSECA